MKLFASLLLGFLLAFPVKAETVDVTSQAVRALSLSSYKSKEVEYGGVIYRDINGELGFTPPRTDNLIDAVRLGFENIPRNADAVAMYHTHPCNLTHIADKFSMVDVVTAVNNDMPMYMLDMCTGYVHVWVPGIDNEPKTNKYKISGGRIVGLVLQK